MENNQNMLMDWNDSIESDGQEFITLEEGDYNFTVIKVERGRFMGSSKISPCNKAMITVAVDTGAGQAIVKFDIILYRTLEWRISAFFRCIGQKKHGECLVMDWNKVVGASGRAHFKPRTFVNNYGEEKTTNDIDKFYDYDPAFFAETAKAPSDGQPHWEEIKTDDDLPF